MNVYTNLFLSAASNAVCPDTKTMTNINGFKNSVSRN